MTRRGWFGVWVAAIAGAIPTWLRLSRPKNKRVRLALLPRGCRVKTYIVPVGGIPGYRSGFVNYADWPTPIRVRYIPEDSSDQLREQITRVVERETHLGYLHGVQLLDKMKFYPGQWTCTYGTAA